MSKKSYKQLQNRLYQEIKRRMLAESRQVPNNCTIETLKFRKYMQMEEDLPGQEDFLDYLLRKSLVKQMVNWLIDGGYIQQSSTITEYPREMAVELSLQVCRPKESKE